MLILESVLRKESKEGNIMAAKKKWGKIGPPKSAKRKAWLKKIRPKSRKRRKSRK